MILQPLTLERIGDIYDVDPAAHTAQRIGILEEVAARLSRRNQVVSKVELANAALAVLLRLLYETDADGKRANVDARTSRILIPLPWGRAGCRAWTLRTSEAVAMRYVMLQRSTRDDAWLRYDADSRNWYVAKPLERHARDYLTGNPITNDEWRNAWAMTRTAWAAEKLALG